VRSQGDCILGADEEQLDSARGQVSIHSPSQARKVKADFVGGSPDRQGCMPLTDASLDSKRMDRIALLVANHSQQKPTKLLLSP